MKYKYSKQETRDKEKYIKTTKKEQKKKNTEANTWINC